MFSFSCIKNRGTQYFLQKWELFLIRCLEIYSEKKFLSKYILAQRFAVSNPPSKYFYIPEFWQAYGLEILPGGEWGGVED